MIDQKVNDMHRSVGRDESLNVGNWNMLGRRSQHSYQNKVGGVVGNCEQRSPIITVSSAIWLFISQYAQSNNYKHICLIQYSNFKCSAHIVSQRGKSTRIDTLLLELKVTLILWVQLTDVWGAERIQLLHNKLPFTRF